MPDDTFTRYTAEFPKYKAVASYVQQQLEDIVSDLGVKARCEARPKEIEGVVRKVRRLETQNKGGYDDVKDKAGARIVVTYPGDLELVMTKISATFPEVPPDDKRQSLSPKTLGYLGVHWDIPIPNGVWKPDAAPDGAFCEIQLQTQSLRLWSDLFHDISYKPLEGQPVNPIHERRIHLLAALCEIVDLEFQSIVDEMSNSEASPALKILFDLERRYSTLTSLGYDRETSINVIESLMDVLGEDSIDDFLESVAKFTDKNSPKLAEIFLERTPYLGEVPYLFQPESLLVFERLAKHKHLLMELWNSQFNPNELKDLAIIWGDPLPDR